MEINSDNVLSLLLGRHIDNPVSIDEMIARFDLTPSNPRMRKLRDTIDSVLGPHGPVVFENGNLWIR